MNQQDDSPAARRQRRRSKRQHRSGPGEDYGIQGRSHLSLSIWKQGPVSTDSNTWVDYPSLLSTNRSAPVPHGQLPSLPQIFTRPATAPAQTLGPEYEWLDPQLVGQSSIEATVNAHGDGSTTRTVFRLTDTRDTASHFSHEDDDEEAIGAWSM